MERIQFLRRYALLATIALLAPAILFAADTITPEDVLRDPDGRGEVEVCGIVASANYAKRERGQPTFLNLDRPFPDHIFTVLIWGSTRHLFSYRPETLNGKNICVRGNIEEYKGKPQIEVYKPSQIRLIESH